MPGRKSTEESVSQDSLNNPIKVHLFVAGDSPSSRRARRTVESLLADERGAASQLEVVDVLREPERALECNLLATPTLIIDNRGEIVRYVGDLYDQDDLVQALAPRCTDSA